MNNINNEIDELFVLYETNKKKKMKKNYNTLYNQFLNYENKQTNIIDKYQIFIEKILINN